MKLAHILDIDETSELTQGQGHGVKGQGQIGNYVKKLPTHCCNLLPFCGP